MNIWSQFTSDFIVVVILTVIIFVAIKYRSVVNENAKLKARDNAEILASVHDIAAGESLKKLISSPDDFGDAGNDSKPE